MWLEVIYEPTTLFSLKQSDATNRGAKSLLAPSPYSVKMALLNALIVFGDYNFESELNKRKSKNNTEKTIFELIKDLTIRFALPNNVVVNNCFIKIQKLKRIEGEEKETETELVDTTVAFREYIYFGGDIRLAFKIDDPSQEKILKEFLPKINYFGKRGCFFQFKGFNQLENEIIESVNYQYCKELSEGLTGSLLTGFLLTKMDDVQDNAKFENLNIYSEKRDAKRTPKFYLIPLTRKKSNKNFTLYSNV